MSERKFLPCVNEEKHSFLSAPGVVSRIDTNPNCNIDKIYKRQEKIEYMYKEIKIPNIVFKHVYQVNTWLFIANKPIVVAITCNGIHKDVKLKDVGIIQIGNHCIIKTNQNILTAETMDTIPVRAITNH